ncbi:MAG TPA: pre-toxin TG domain-containing protein, partial [Anoxybacillus sp.]|nr:pre-toxin TG domain-containing protein [Anoxybacillus sp.]
TGEKLSRIDRTLAGVGIVTGGWGKSLGKGTKAAFGLVSDTGKASSAVKFDKLTEGTPKLDKPSTKGTGKFSKYDVGLYKEIKGVPGLDAHHVGQKAIMKKFIRNYDPNNAPAILVPKAGHTRKGPRGIVSRSSKGIESVRQLLARDIMELRRVYPDIPNSQLRKLIELNKQLYPEMRRR